MSKHNPMSYVKHAVKNLNIKIIFDVEIYLLPLFHNKCHSILFFCYTKSVTLQFQCKLYLLSSEN